MVKLVQLARLVELRGSNGGIKTFYLRLGTFIVEPQVATPLERHLYTYDTLEHYSIPTPLKDRL